MNQPGSIFVRADTGEEQTVPINTFELTHGLMVVAPMPGLHPDDVELTITENVLSLRGRRSPGQDDKQYTLKEWDYGPYVRTFELPFNIDPDRVIATLDNGVLTVNLRKADSAQPKQVRVRVAAERSLTGGESHHSPQGMEREKTASTPR
jgi:HSP20 family protein